MTDAKPGLKAKALHEFRRFATMFAYLWVMFFLLQLHQYVILAQRHIPFEQYGDVLPTKGVILEIASGSGEHVVHFARNFPNLFFQPSDREPDALQSVAAWVKAMGGHQRARANGSGRLAVTLADCFG